MVYLFLPLFFILTSALLDFLYAAAFEISPNLLPKYDRVLEKEKYLEFSRIMNFIAALLSVFFVGYVTAVYDNARYEDVITKTSGLYKIPKLLPSYFKGNVISDVLASALAPAAFIALTLPSYTEKALEYFGIFLLPHLHVRVLFSPSMAYFLLFATLLFGRILAMPRALSRFRSTWLASFVDS